MSEAKVYLLTRPLRNVGWFLRLLGTGGQHWALIVKFLDGPEYYLFEIGATSDSTGCSSTATKRRDTFDSLQACKENNTEANIELLGNSVTDIEHLEDFMTQVLENDEYLLFSKNCQTFVKQLIIYLNVKNNNGESVLPTNSITDYTQLVYSSAHMVHVYGTCSYYYN